MSVNTVIETALKDVVDGKIWPMVCPDDSTPEKYIVYNPEIEEPAIFADDEDQEWIQHIQIHLFIQGNYIQMRKEIRNKLKEAGFTVTDITTTYDNGYNHLCFECYIEEVE